MAVSIAVRLYPHGSGIAAAAAAAVATAAASTPDLSDRLMGSSSCRPVLFHAAEIPLTSASQVATVFREHASGNLHHPPKSVGHFLSASASRSPPAFYCELMPQGSLSVAKLAQTGAQCSHLLSHVQPYHSHVNLLRLQPHPRLINLPSYSLRGEAPTRAFLGPFSSFSPFLPSPQPPSSPAPSAPQRPLHQWHKAASQPFGNPIYDRVQSTRGSGGNSSGAKRRPTVILLGWLGAQQKHLKLYAEWYNAQGIDAVTFVIPMRDVLSVKPGDKAELHVDALLDQLHTWLHPHVATSSPSSTSPVTGDPNSAPPPPLLFHTFSNTGWLTYGALLKKLREKYGPEIDSRIRGCVVDSAPALEQDPEVWASGFATAILKKRSASTQPSPSSSSAPTEMTDLRSLASQSGAADIEAALASAFSHHATIPATVAARREGQEGVQQSLSAAASPSDATSAASFTNHPDGGIERAVRAVLKQFFSVFLRIPAVAQRLSEITSVLAHEQPPCPQLYIYSDTDSVIPPHLVESFIALQQDKQKGQDKGAKSTGHKVAVSSFRLQGSPHVDHFRTFPLQYGQRLRSFLDTCLDGPGQP